MFFFSGLSYVLPLEFEQECLGPGGVSLLVDQSFDALISLPVTKAQDRLQLMDGLTIRLKGLRGMNRPWYTVPPNMEDPCFHRTFFRWHDGMFLFSLYFR